MWWFMVVTVVARLIEIGFYMQNQTQNNFLAYFPQHRQTIKNIFLYTKNILHLKNILHKAKHSLSFTSFF